MADQIDFSKLTHLTNKERLAVKRQIKYRTDEEYRRRMKEKVVRSKQREEYKRSQRDYNRMYYQRMKERLKQKREMKKNSSFEEPKEVTYVEYPTTFVEVQDNNELIVEESEEVEEIAEVEAEAEPKEEDQELLQELWEVDVEEEGEEEEEAATVVYEDQETYELEQQGETEEIIHYHAYPRIKTPPRTRPNVKRGVDRMVQADMGDEVIIEPRIRSPKVILHLVDVGTQVSEEEIILEWQRSIAC